MSCGECNLVGDLMSLRKVHVPEIHRSVFEISKNTGIRRSPGSSVARIIHDHIRATHPEENDIINQLLMYSWVNLPRWLSWLRHSVHRPGWSVGGAGVQFPGSAGRFVFGYQGHML